MTFKKRGPGCPCECGETPCDERCLFKCIGETCSPICKLMIDMPTPDETGVISEGCPPEDPSCPTSAKCVACFQAFQGQINFYKELLSAPNCNDWSYEFDIDTGYDGVYAYCWDILNADCPYNTSADLLEDCNIASEILILPADLNGNSIKTIKLSGTWDGSCGEIEIVIRYLLRREVCSLTIPIPDPCPETGFLNVPLTYYEHTFRLEYCTCEELLNNFTYIGTTSQNNCRGETIPDPCNFPEAIINLRDVCEVCSCYECNGPVDTVTLSVSGPGFTGTLGLGSRSRPNPGVSLDLYQENFCWFGADLPIECSYCTYGDVTIAVIVEIECICDAYNVTISIRVFNMALGTERFVAEYSKQFIGAQCGDTLTMSDGTLSGPAYDICGEFCDITDYTFSITL